MTLTKYPLCGRLLEMILLFHLLFQLRSGTPFLPVPVLTEPPPTVPNSPLPSLSSILSGAGCGGQRETSLAWEIFLVTLKRYCFFNWSSESRGLGSRHTGIKALPCLSQHHGVLSGFNPQMSSAFLQSEHHMWYRVVWL